MGIHQFCPPTYCGNPPILSSELLWESTRVYKWIPTVARRTELMDSHSRSEDRINSRAGVSILRYLGRTLPRKNSHFSWFYKKLGPFYKKLNFEWQSIFQHCMSSGWLTYTGIWSGGLIVFSCPQQLNRWPCHSLTDWLTHSTFTFDITEWP